MAVTPPEIPDGTSSENTTGGDATATPGAGQQKTVKQWRKRVDAAKEGKKNWEQVNRVETCYQYWRGEQRGPDIFDEFGQRRAQVNKIHPAVKNQLPSLYFYRPNFTLTAEPEEADDPGTDIESDTELLQATLNHLVADPTVRFRESTFLALKEAHWAGGCVEVGYSAEWVDDPDLARPPLQENEKVDVGQDGSTMRTGVFGGDPSAQVPSTPESDIAAGTDTGVSNTIPSAATDAEQSPGDAALAPTALP